MIKREILDKIIPWLGKEKIIILKGARRVGKTTLLNLLKERIETAGSSQTAYILGDDLDNRAILQGAANVEAYLQQYHDFPGQFLYLFIDEFQAIENSGVLLKNLFDKHKGRIQIIASGSSSLEINKSAEFLTGRAVHFDIDRVNFKEFFDYQEGVATKRFDWNDQAGMELFHNTFKPKLEAAFFEYLTFGGYPEVVTTAGREDKELILKAIISTYIEKDVVNQLNVENVAGFNNLIKILAGQVGQLMNRDELSNTANLSINTLKRYLDILAGTYIVSLATPYYQNIRSEISKMPKAYLLDPGLRSYLLRTFDAEAAVSGGTVENFVYKVLLGWFESEYVHFYRTIGGAEIDFIIEAANNRLIPCEVKYWNKATAPVIMKNFSQRHPGQVDRIIIATKDTLKIESNIHFIPAVMLPFVDFSVW